jgi:predicted nuclease of predicted toxin-antitoxin system
MKKLLLDENLPKKLAKYFSAEFDVTTVSDLGWQSKTNGELLSAPSEAGIEFLITAGKNLRRRQNLSKCSVKEIVLETCDTRLKYLLGHVDSIENATRELAGLDLLHVVDLSPKK